MPPGLPTKHGERSSAFWTFRRRLAVIQAVKGLVTSTELGECHRYGVGVLRTRSMCLEQAGKSQGIGWSSSHSAAESPH